MHRRFLHGIRRSFLAACGGSQSCLPALALFKAIAAKKALHEGDLLPSPSGEDTGCLLPVPNGDEEEGDLLPHSGGNEEGVLPPQREDEASKSLQPIEEGHVNEDKGIISPMRGEEDEAEGNFLPINVLNDDGGTYHPANTKEDETACNLQQQPQQEGQTEKDQQGIFTLVVTKFNLPMIANFKKPTIFFLRHHILQTLLFINDVMFHHLHVPLTPALLFAPYPPWLMPSPRPRVKMKGDMKQNDVHVWKHDAWVSSTSSSNSSIPSLLLPPLRGSNRCQDRQKRMKTPRAAMKTTMKIRMKRHFYLTKDVLDPG